MRRRRVGVLRRRYGRAGKMPLEGRYYERRRRAKWNIEPNVLIAREGPLTRQMFPEMSKADHERAARSYAAKARKARHGYQVALDNAVKKYGDLAPGVGAVSGIYNPAFPDATKDRLREILRHVNDYTDASIAHWAASGKRTQWRDALGSEAGL